jgi:Na+/melibiose symporter-like transporter
MIDVPAVALGIAVIAMLANPLRKGVHSALVVELERRRATAVAIPPSA